MLIPSYLSRILHGREHASTGLASRLHCEHVRRTVAVCPAPRGTGMHRSTIAPLAFLKPGEVCRRRRPVGCWCRGGQRRRGLTAACRHFLGPDLEKNVEELHENFDSIIKDNITLDSIQFTNLAEELVALEASGANPNEIQRLTEKLIKVQP